jgi:hypothetical protein
MDDIKYYTYEEVLSDLRAIAASKPDGYRYTHDPEQIDAMKRRNALKGNMAERGVDVDENGAPYISDCLYRTVDGDPGCIIGHLLYKYAPDYVPTESHDAQHVIIDAGLLFERKALALSSFAQSHQDNCLPWKEAVELAARETINH